MIEDGYERLYLNQIGEPPKVLSGVSSTFKTFVVSYSIGSYKYESDVRTSSSQAAILWAEALGATNITVLPGSR